MLANAQPVHSIIVHRSLLEVAALQLEGGRGAGYFLGANGLRGSVDHFVKLITDGINALPLPNRLLHS